MYLNSLFSVLNRSSSTLPSTRRRFLEILTHNALAIRSYSYNSAVVADLKSSEQSNPSIVTHLEKWIEEGNKVKAAELRGIVRDLRIRGRESIALQVSEWVYKNRLCWFSSSDNAVQILLLGKVRGADAAKDYHNSLSDVQKDCTTYSALKKYIKREKYRDIYLLKKQKINYASTVLNCNDLICLYANLGQYKKVLDVLAEMKGNGVSLDIFSYRTCIMLYGMRYDIDGMEKLLQEMESQSHIEMDRRTLSLVAKYYLKSGLIDKAIVALKRMEEKRSGHSHLSYSRIGNTIFCINPIEFYSSIGNKTELLRFWDLQKDARIDVRNYGGMVDALVKLGGLEEAKSLIEEYWESSDNCREQNFDCRERNLNPKTFLIGFCKEGLFEEAEALLLNMLKMGIQRIKNGWARVVTGYISNGEMLKAVNCMKAALVAFSMSKEFETKIERLLTVWQWLDDEVCKEEDAEILVGLLKIKQPIDRETCSTSFKKEVDLLHEEVWMVEDDVTPVGVLKIIEPTDREMCSALFKAYRVARKKWMPFQNYYADRIDEDEKEETQNIQNSKQSFC